MSRNNVNQTGANDEDNDPANASSDSGPDDLPENTNSPLQINRCQTPANFDHFHTVLVNQELEQLANNYGDGHGGRRSLTPITVRAPSPIFFEMGDDGELPKYCHYELHAPIPRRIVPAHAEAERTNTQICPVRDAEDGLSRAVCLETIYEGVFLGTPPPSRPGSRHASRARTNFIRKMTLNRWKIAKGKLPLLCRETAVNCLIPPQCNQQPNTKPSSAEPPSSDPARK